MTKIIVTCSNMHPGLTELWHHTWDEIKQRHPQLKIVVFSIPIYKEVPAYDVFRSPSFKKWYEERKEWIEIAQQGYGHKNKRDCKRFEQKQLQLLKRGLLKIGHYMPKELYSFRAPDYIMNQTTWKVLKQLEFSSCLYYGKLVVLDKMEKALEDHIIIESNLSIDEKYPDDIQKIKHKVDKQLTNLEAKGYDYSTIHELLKQSRGESIMESVYEEEDNDEEYDDDDDDED